MKLYTEEQVRKAMAIGYDWCHQKHIPSDDMIDISIKSLITIELPSDEEILNESDEFELNSRVSLGMHQSFEIGAKWMRDKIKNK